MSAENKASTQLRHTVAELIQKLRTAAEPTGRLHQEVKGALAAKLVEQLCDSIDRHERAASRLSIQLLWLNILLGLFTVVGTVLAIWTLLQ